MMWSELDPGQGSSPQAGPKVAEQRVRHNKKMNPQVQRVDGVGRRAKETKRPSPSRLDAQIK